MYRLYIYIKKNWWGITKKLDREDNKMKAWANKIILN